MPELEAKDTLTPVELNRGEGFTFKLRNGEVREFVLEDTFADVLLTSCADTRVEEPDGGTMYHFTCRVRIDGHRMTMERYVCSQECFYEPYVINGMRVWFDGVQDIFDFTMENHGPCKPNRHARFAVQDATLPICPQEMVAWCPIDGQFIDVGDCYNGDDPWMGPYLGGTAHGGMDINHPRGTPLWAPIDFDYGHYHACVARGANNNRWEGVRRWPDGSTWVLGTYHVIRTLVPEHAPIKAGTHYAEAAGVWVGSHDHTHFVFKVKERGQVFHLDPWILFRQIFENEKRTVVDMAPLGPARTGESVAFFDRTRNGHKVDELAYYWTFGDGGCSTERNPRHTFVRRGIYPVTLTVEAGQQLVSRTQHITVDGDPVDVSAPIIEAPDEPSFRLRPVHAMDVYGWGPSVAPHTLTFTARPGSRGELGPRRVIIWNAPRAGPRSPLFKIVAPDEGGLPPRFLSFRSDEVGDALRLDVGILLVDALDPGTYEATVEIPCKLLTESPPCFRVVLNVVESRPSAPVTVDDLDDGFYATPYFWVGPRFNHWKELGHGGRYLADGGRASKGEFARFTPDLGAGRYEVAFSDLTPFREGARFFVRVRHKDGEDALWVEPARSLVIGTFDFDEGTDGFVELTTAGSTGQVLADAVTFRPVQGV